MYQPLAALTRGLCQEFTEVDVLLKRAVPYQTHGREQGTEADAWKIDEKLTGAFDVTVETPAPLDVISRLDPLVLPLLS